MADGVGEGERDRMEEDRRLTVEKTETWKREKNHILRLQQHIADLTNELELRATMLATSIPERDGEQLCHDGLPTGISGVLKPEAPTPLCQQTTAPKSIQSGQDGFAVPRCIENELKTEGEMQSDVYVTHRKKHVDSDSTAKPVLGKEQQIKVKPAIYDGSGPWTDYYAHFEACAKLNGWDKYQKGLYLSVSLRGSAQGVLGNLERNSADYSALVQALQDRFAPPNQTELYRVQLRDRRQKATEPLAELGQDIRRLTNLAYPSFPLNIRETLAKEQFVDALANFDMRLKVRQARPTSLNDAVRISVELEAFYQAEKEQHGHVKKAGSDASNSKAIEDLQKAVVKIQVILEDLIRDMGKERPTQKQPHRRPDKNRKIGVRQERQSKPYNTTRPNRPIRKCYGCGSDKHLNSTCPETRRSMSGKKPTKSVRDKNNVAHIATKGLSRAKTKPTPRKLPTICPGCKVKVKVYQEHVKTCKAYIKGKVSCSFCKKNFWKTAYLRKHMKSAHGKVASKSKENATVNTVQQHRDHPLQTGKRTTPSKPFAPKNKTSKTVPTHVQTEPRTEKALRANGLNGTICVQYHKNIGVQTEKATVDCATQYVSDLQEKGSQIDLKESDKFKYQCAYCDVRYKNQVMFLIHQSCHTYDEPFKCKACRTVCTDSLEFYTHINVDHFRDD